MPATGTGTAIAGRLIPGSRPKRSNAAAIVAPVLPAPTIACARPSRTASAQRTTDASRFERIAVAGSSISTTSEAGSTVTERAPESPPASNGASRSGCPARSTSTSSVAAASIAPATIASGALSPPMASMAIVIAPVCGPAASFTRAVPTELPAVAVRPSPDHSTSTTWRPRYQPQLAQTVWGRREAPQFGHSECAAGSMR